MVTFLGRKYKPPLPVSPLKHTNHDAVLMVHLKSYLETFEGLRTNLYPPRTSHFDYAVSVWDPYKIKHITDIEDLQRRATKLIPEIKKLCYPERLKKLNLPTLAYRRIRGQMIEVYKIINNIITR